MADRTTPKRQQTNTRNMYRIPGADDYRDKTYLRGNTKKNTNTASEKKRTSGHGSRAKHAGKSSNILGPLLGILCGSGAVAFMLMLVWIVQAAGNNKTRAEMNIGNNNNQNSFVEDTKEQYVSIDAQSFCAYIGQRFTLSVSAYPAELADSVIWTSNNQDVLTVDSYGNVEIVGEGVAAITATFGEYSDAIAVEAVADAYSQSTMGLPFYSKVDVTGEQPTPVSPSNSGNGTDMEGVSESQPYEPESGASGENADSSDDGQNNGTQHPSDSGQNGGIQHPSDSGQNGGIQQPSDGGQNNGTQEPSDSGQNNGAQQPSGNEQNGGSQEQGGQEETSEQYTEPEKETAPSINTEEMFAVLTASGFSQYISNACLYETDDEYQGEVIVDSESVHIYIKKRSATFDQAIKNALAYLLPETSDNVWNSYLTATTDKTITSGGRKVRFVMPAAQAHAQIIVYNP